MSSLLLLSVLSAGAAQAQPVDCDRSATPSELSAELLAAEAAFEAMDLQGFESHQSAAMEVLPCLGQVLLPSDAAAVHRVQALGAFLAEDRAGTVAAFRAVASAEPSWTPSDELAPVGHPLREQHETARVLPPSPREEVVGTGGTTLYLDGSAEVGRPSDQPTVVQALSPRGDLVGSAWLGVGEELPSWATTPDALDSRDTPRDSAKGGGPRLALLVPTGVVAAGAAGTYAWAWSSRATYLDESTPYGELEGIRSRTQTLSTTSAVLGGLALGLGTATVLTWEW